MNRKNAGTLLTAVLLFFSVNPGLAQIATFEETLSKSGMLFEMPQGYEEVPVIGNRSMLYSYAIKNKEMGIEVRYRIDLPKTNDSSRVEQPGRNEAMAALSVLYNISDKSVQIPALAKRLMVVNKEQANRDYNADAAFISFLKPGEEFGQQYKNCGMSLITKEGVAKAWIFMLFDDADSFRQHTHSVATALKFSE